MSVDRHLRVSRALFPWNPQTGDIYIMRRIILGGGDDPDRLEILTTADPQELWLWRDVGYGWGPQRREGATLALAIMDRHIGRPNGEVCDLWHRPLACSPTAFLLAGPFQDAFLSDLPSHGGRISGDRIRQWIGANRPSVDGTRTDLGWYTLLDRWPE